MMKLQLNRLVFCFAVLTALLAFVPAAQAAQLPAQTSNIGAHDYINNRRWTDPACSSLVSNGDGTFTRVEYTGEAVTAEVYDENLDFVSQRTIEMELPIYGGFHSGEDFNFLVFGQENPDEDDSVEVIRVVQYSKEWERLGAASLFGANTTVPFDAGGLSMEEYNGYLYLRTSHEMYADGNGTNHQANLTMNVRISDMAVTDSFCDVMNVRYGYVSHSFNQFIRVDGDGRLVAVDHGDAHPRSVVLTRYYAPAGQDEFMLPVREPLGDGYFQFAYVQYVDVLPIMGSTGANDTGVSIGGFDCSDSSYLIAGSTVSQGESYDPSGQRNIFLSATSMEDFSSEGTTIHYLTAFAEGDSVTVSNPQLVKISADSFLILWTETSDSDFRLCYAFADGTGQLTSEVYSTAGVQSDCQPIVSGGKVIWYVTDFSGPRFFTIDLTDPETVTHDCVYGYSVNWPSNTEGGSVGCTCIICGSQVSYQIPALTDEGYDVTVLQEPDCSDDGLAIYVWTHPQYGQLRFYGPYGIGGHKGVYQETVAPTCTEQGYDVYVCQVCGEEYHYNFVASYGGHDLSTWTLPEQYECETTVTQYRQCSRCDYRVTRDYYVSHDNTNVLIPATCYDWGQIYTVCNHCGYQSEPERFPGDAPKYHNWTQWTVIKEPTCTEYGLQTRTCTLCGEISEIQPVRLGHDFVGRTCARCGAVKSGTPFVDVASGAFYYDPVLWALDNQITNGVDDTHFGPEVGCTRGQIVTFLWRAAGEPVSSASVNSFVDVRPGAYYYEAVLWAVEQGITNGMDATHFAPDATCTRGQIVTFLWRFSGSPEESAGSAFTDVAPGQFYTKAVAWAVKNEITNGIDATHFAPNATCTRGQIVTFLYRAMN